MPRTRPEPVDFVQKQRKFMLDTICRAEPALVLLLVEEVQKYWLAQAGREDAANPARPITLPGDTIPGPLPGPCPDYVPADHEAYEEYLRTRPFHSPHFTFSGWLRNPEAQAARRAEPGGPGSTKRSRFDGVTKSER